VLVDLFSIYLYSFLRLNFMILKPLANMSEEEGSMRFLKIAGRLKKEYRRGWIEKAGIENPESVADHTFRTALLVMLIGDSRKLDTEKMMKMALIHDLGESIVGDITPTNDEKLKDKEIVENAAIIRIFNNLSTNIREDYLKLWNELRSGKSLEARLVSEADKLEMAIQASDYEEDGFSKISLVDFKLYAKNRILDGQILRMLDLV